MSDKKKLKQITAVAFWVTVWFIIAWIVGNPVLIASPVDTVLALAGLLGNGSFYMAVAGSVTRIMVGFLSGMVIAFVLAVMSYRYDVARTLIAPVINLCKSVPVAAFAVILIIWWGPSNLALIISLIIVMPVAYHNILEGILSTDSDMLEMAKVFNMSAYNKAMFIYRNSLSPYLISSVKSGIGMSWKAGVAAEVIGMTNNSIGGQLYTSKVYFNTAEVFALALVTVALSFLAEKLMVWLAEIILKMKVTCAGVKREDEAASSIELSNVSKSFGKKSVYDDYSNVFEAGQKYTISTESGSGKTTLLHMIAGILVPDSGSIKSGNVGMVFQEDRLCEEYSAVENVTMTGTDITVAREALSRVLDPESLDKPCKELSGGMKRRVAIVRAVEYPAGIVLMDEPFTGMDEETIARVKAYLDDRLQTRTVIVATHII